MADNYQKPDPSNPAPAYDEYNDRSSWTWLWIILALIAIIGAYSTYSSKRANIDNGSHVFQNDAATNGSTGQTAPNTQAPNTEAPNTEAPNTESPNTQR